MFFSQLFWLRQLQATENDSLLACHLSPHWQLSSTFSLHILNFLSFIPLYPFTVLQLSSSPSTLTNGRCFQWQLSPFPSEILLKHPMCTEWEFRVFPLISSEALLSSLFILINNYDVVVGGVIQWECRPFLRNTHTIIGGQRWPLRRIYYGAAFERAFMLFLSFCMDLVVIPGFAFDSALPPFPLTANPELKEQPAVHLTLVALEGSL